MTHNAFLPFKTSRKGGFAVKPKPSFISFDISLAMESSSRLERIIHNADEIVTESELKALIDEKKKPSAYIGIEPSGLVHIGTKICIDKVKDLLDSGFTVTILLADWHAYLNDKLGIPASTRVSFYLYNTKEDIDTLVEGINKAVEI